METKCVDVCYKILKMMLAAGEDYHGLCEVDTSGVNHEKLETLLEEYKLVKKNDED